MDKGYSGLRRTRKRAHSSKCPCCYSSEEEQENHASTKKEKIKDGNQDNGKQRSSSRKRRLASDSDDDDSNVKDVASSPAETVDENQNSKKSHKTLLSEKPQKNGSKRKITASKQESAKNARDGVEEPEQDGKQNSKVRRAAARKKNRTGVSTYSNKDKTGEGTNLTESKDGLENTLSAESKSKSKKAKKKNANTEFKNDAEDADKNEQELQKKSLNSKKNNTKVKTSTSLRSNGTQKQSNKDVGDNGLVEKGKSSSKSKKTDAAKVSNAENDKQNKSRGKPSKSRDAASGSSRELIKGKEVIPLESNKHPKINPNSGSQTKRKVEVFDHLFCEMKKCPGFSKLTVSSAAEMLLKLTADKSIKSMLYDLSPQKSKTGLGQSNLDSDNLPPSSSKTKTFCTLSEPKRRRTQSEKSSLVISRTNSTSCFSSPRKMTSGKAEEAKLSQAAEALVSFRANPTILRQEKTESSDKDTVNTNAGKTFNTLQSSAIKETRSSVAEAPMQIATTTSEVRMSQTFDSFYVNAPSQNQAASQPQSSLLFQGAMHQPVSFPTNIEANLKQVATVQPTLMSLNQLASQLNSAPAVGPRVSTPVSENLPTSVMSSIMMNPVGVQNIQALFCRPTRPSNTQTSVAAQTPVPPLAASGNNQQLRPQQPLKGMEDVVSCVGSRSSTNLLWNIKPATPPVVYLTSPQTLSGVRARNLIPQSESRVPFTPGVAKVQSVGIPKTSLSSASTSVLTLGKVTLVNQTAPLSTANVTGQRPILPREQRLPSLFPSVSQSAPLLPATTVGIPVPHNVPPVHVGSMPVQFSNLGVTSPLNTRQTPVSTVVMQAPVTQAPVMQAACVTTGQLTAVSSAVLTPVSAKQAVKKFVHQRTKSAELKQSNSLSNLMLTESAPSTAVTSGRPESSTNTAPSLQERQFPDQSKKQNISNLSEFNLEQAASALLSISTQESLDTANTAQQAVGEGENSLDEHDDEVVYTSKGVFRVGDVDVDPKYNRIGREGYTCGKCGKIFTSLSYLARHIKRVCPDMSCRKWKCTMCDKAFRHPFGLQQHVYTHTGERPHKCSQCPKAFYSSNDLRRHSRIHSGERPYHCKHCDKSFATTISLKTHTYIHTGEKPHKCPHCPKTFATSSKLGRHIVTHSEQRPFTCDHCPKSFNRSGDLRRHNMHVHECRGDKQLFEFDDCGTPLNTTRNVSGDIPKDQCSVSGQMLLCSVCGEIFDSSNNLRRHLLSHDVPESPAYDGTMSNPVAARTSNQGMLHLDESTESASGDSNN